jgi:hypothetical protein
MENTIKKIITSVIVDIVINQVLEKLKIGPVMIHTIMPAAASANDSGDPAQRDILIESLCNIFAV